MDVSKLISFGRSLGGAVAIHIAARRAAALSAVIVENTFTSIDDMVSARSANLHQLVLPKDQCS